VIWGSYGQLLSWDWLKAGRCDLVTVLGLAEGWPVWVSYGQLVVEIVSGG